MESTRNAPKPTSAPLRNRCRISGKHDSPPFFENDRHDTRSGPTALAREPPEAQSAPVGRARGLQDDPQEAQRRGRPASRVGAAGTVVGREPQPSASRSKQLWPSRRSTDEERADLSHTMRERARSLSGAWTWAGEGAFAGASTPAWGARPVPSASPTHRPRHAREVACQQRRARRHRRREAGQTRRCSVSRGQQAPQRQPSTARRDRSRSPARASPPPGPRSS